MNGVGQAAGRWLSSRARGAFLGVSVSVLIALSAYALLILQPLSVENEAMRVRAASLAALSRQLKELGGLLAALKHDVDREASSYQSMLRDLRGWRVEAHTHISRIAADAGLEVTAMEWTEAESATPAFETDRHRRWLRTGVFIRLVGGWQSHLSFAHGLSRCDCLVQVSEEEVTASGRAGLIEASMSLFVYHPGGTHV